MKTKKVKTSELQGPVLDWAVAKIEYPDDTDVREPWAGLYYGFYEDWSQGGPIIEREHIELRHDGRASWCAWIASTGAVHGQTPLVAAMRCYVASKLGDEMDVPKELA